MKKWTGEKAAALPFGQKPLRGAKTQKLAVSTRKQRRTENRAALPDQLFLFFPFIPAGARG